MWEWLRVETVVLLFCACGVYFWISLWFSEEAESTLRRGWAWLRWRPLPHDLPATAFGGFCVAFLLQTLLAVFLLGEEGERPDWPPGLVLLLSVLLFQGLLAGVILLRVRRARVSLREAFGLESFLHWRDMAWGLAGYCMALPVVLFTGLVTRAVYVQLNWEWNMQPLVERLGEIDGVLNWISLFVMVGLVGPMLEELIFRGFLFAWLAQRWGAFAGVTVQAAVFAVIHQHGASTLTLFGLAVMLGLVYVYTRRLAACIWMHAVFNSMTLFHAVTTGGVAP